MKEESKFYIKLKEAKYDKFTLNYIINGIMPLINKYSIYNGEIDEDLQEILIEYAIKMIKSDNFAEKFVKK